MPPKRPAPDGAAGSPSSSGKPKSRPQPGSQPQAGSKNKASSTKHTATIPTHPKGPSSSQRDRGPRPNAEPRDHAGGRSQLQNARAIAAQGADAALKDGELDVQAFLNARSFELRALDEGMKRTKANQTSRAFQTVPITLRRRAAAHNHTKLPKRLQKRAKREMATDNTPTVNSRTRKPKSSKGRLRAETARKLGLLARRSKALRSASTTAKDGVAVAARSARPKIRRNTLNDPAVTVRKYRRRQLNKTWLPTHMWHAKRARMTEPTKPLWRFAVPLTPTAKGYRPTHRNQWERGAIAWDTSYMSTIGLSGPFSSLQSALKSLGLAQEPFWGDKGQRWRNGSVHWAGSLTRNKSGIDRLIGPATVLWNPSSAASPVKPKKDRRQVFIRVHPAGFLETFNELLRVTRGLTPRPYLEDLRYEIGSIEITGPASTEALLGVLKPYHSKHHPKEAHGASFTSLSPGQDPATLALGSQLSFSIMDPRLQYPPQKVPISKADPSATLQIQADVQEPFGLFSRDLRHRASRLPSQKSLNRRRGKGAPGVFLKPTQGDPPIPVLLLASRHPTDPRAPGTWTLMLPWKCVLPVWYSLMHYPLSSGGNPKFGGLDETRQLTFERHLAWYPGDMPGTDAGNSWEAEERLLRRQKWDRMPKGKRANYDTLDLGGERKGEVGVPWNCDYEHLLNLQASSGPADNPGTRDVGDDSAMDTSDDSGPSLVTELSAVTHLSKPSFNKHSSRESAPPLSSSLVTVHIHFLDRGTPSSCARVYRLPESPGMLPAATETRLLDKSLAAPNTALSLREQWLAQRPSVQKAKPKSAMHSATDLQARTRRLAEELLQDPTMDKGGLNGHPACPGERDLIGFVNTGEFSLRDGQGAAIGTLSAARAKQELARYGSRDDPAARLCVVRNVGERIGRLAKWQLL